MKVGNESREIKIEIRQTGTVNDNYNTTIISTRAAAVLCIGRPPTSVLVCFSLSFSRRFSLFVRKQIIIKTPTHEGMNESRTFINAFFRFTHMICVHFCNSEELLHCSSGTTCRRGIEEAIRSVIKDYGIVFYDLDIENLFD